MVSVRIQLLLGLLLFAAIMGFGTYYLRETANLVKQMPPQSVALINQAAREVEHNRQNSLHRAGIIFQQQKQKIKDFLKSAKQKPTNHSTP